MAGETETDAGATTCWCARPTSLHNGCSMYTFLLPTCQPHQGAQSKSPENKPASTQTKTHASARSKPHTPKARCKLKRQLRAKGFMVCRKMCEQTPAQETPIFYDLGQVCWKSCVHSPSANESEILFLNTCCISQHLAWKSSRARACKS